MIGADIGRSTGNVASSCSGKNRIAKSYIDLQLELRPGEFSAEPDVNTVVLVTHL